MDTSLVMTANVKQFKGTVPRDFRLLIFFSHKSVSSKYLSILLQPFQIFSKIRGDIRGSRCTTGINDLPPVSTTPVANFAPSFASCCQRRRWQNCHRCRWYRWQAVWYRWCTLTSEYLREFSKKFQTVVMGYSGAGGKLTQEKTRSKKSRETVPLNRTILLYPT